MALVAGACAMWIAVKAEPLLYLHTMVIGPLHGEWWKVFANQFVYFESGGASVYAFVAIFATGLFGWLLEHRHGPALVLSLFLGAGVAGTLVALVVYPEPFVAGANAGALALLAAWAVPDLLASRAGASYDGDLLGAGAIAALLLAAPFARPEASWLAGLVGAVIGLAVGLGLAQMARSEA
jgi:Rhomboid family